MLLAALVFAPAASAGPAEDYQAVRADYQGDSDVTSCRFTRQQLQNTKDNTPPDVANYDPNFVTEVDTEIRRWDTGGCKSGAGAQPDTKKPTLGSLSFSRSSFAAASSGPAFTSRKKPPVGTKVSFNLSEASSVKFTVQRKTRGRRVSGRCRARTRKNAKRPRCTRYKKVAGSFTIQGKAGKNTFTFRGRIGGKKLRTGSYRLNATATDPAKNASLPRRKGFRIIR